MKLSLLSCWYATSNTWILASIYTHHTLAYHHAQYPIKDHGS